MKGKFQKKASEIVKWFEENNWKVDDDPVGDFWVPPEEQDGPYFCCSMFNECGQDVTDSEWTWREEWLEN